MKKQQGFIIKIILIVGALILLGVYLNWDILNFLQKPETKNILINIWNYVVLIWHYVKIGFSYIVSLF